MGTKKIISSINFRIDNLKKSLEAFQKLKQTKKKNKINFNNIINDMESRIDELESLLNYIKKEKRTV
jgi:chromosome segregation ATPase